MDAFNRWVLRHRLLVGLMWLMFAPSPAPDATVRSAGTAALWAGNSSDGSSPARAWRWLRLPVESVIESPVQQPVVATVGDA